MKDYCTRESSPYDFSAFLHLWEEYMLAIVSVVIRETEINFVVKQYPIIGHQFVSNFDL